MQFEAHDIYAASHQSMIAPTCLIVSAIVRRHVWCVHFLVNFIFYPTFVSHEINMKSKPCSTVQIGVNFTFYTPAIV